MKGLVLVMSIAAVFMLLFGCAGQQAAPEQQPEAPPTPAPEPVKNVTKVAEPPPFQPVHLSYLFTSPGPQGQAGQKVSFDYYFDEKTTCGGRPALNGFMKATRQGEQGSSYQKATVYLDTGEAVYSDQMGEADLAFDTAKPKMVDFDFGFYLQSLAARGGMKFLSEDVWNATKPVLLKNVSISGGVGDYSIISTGSDKVAGLDCKEFTVSIKASNMEGQIVMCVHQLPDVALSFLTSAAFPGEGNPSWQLTAVEREKPPIAYYPQCLEPVSCPSVSKPTQQDYDDCGAKGNTLESKRDERGCVTAFNCITREEQAREAVVSNQRQGCEVKDEFVQQAKSCWENRGNANFVQGQDGCLQKVECTIPEPGPGGNPPQQ